MIVVIDYGLGNLASVANALTKLEIPFKVSSQIEDLRSATALILPGVGAAAFGMKNLRERKLDAEIKTQVALGKPLLGICLGMQLLFSSSDEGDVACLDLVKGKVKKIETKLKVPQIGWNQVMASDSKLLKGIKNESYFYFVHSYYCDPSDCKVVTGKTNYDQDFCSVLEAKNIYGVQFHPEKSGEAGLKLLRNFWELVC
jgi:glutamine amidotransferase